MATYFTGIIKREGIYVSIYQLPVNTREVLIENEQVIVGEFHREDDVCECHLYGGRVLVSYEQTQEYYLQVDGIRIIDFSLYSNNCSLDIERVTHYLNQIEQLGVDKFVENYKTVIIQRQEALMQEKSEIEKILENQESPKLLNRLEKLRDLSRDSLFILFMLMMHQPCGIGDAKYIDVFNTITTIYSE